MRTTSHNLPDHAALEAAEVVPFIENLLKSHEKEIETIVQSVGDQPTWDNLMMPIEALDVELNDAWAPVSHMNSVVSNDALRKAHDESVQQLSEFETRKSQYKPLYEAINILADHVSFDEFTPPQQKMVNDALRQFRRNGVALDESKRAEFRELSLKLTQLSTEFANHLLDATDAWFLHVTNEDDLQGIPDANLAVAEAAAKGKQLSGFVLTLDMASYSSTMMHCDNRAIRAEMYEAYATRASDVGPHAGTYDNSDIVKEILNTRTKLANLVDFENYAEYSIDPKMASSASEVHDFLRDLLAKAAPQAQSELKRMQEFAELKLGYDQLEPWDLSFVAEKMRKSLFDVADDQLKPYFPLDQVVSGMFSLVEDLFNVAITKMAAPASWHPDVRYYEIARGEEVIARFYLDAFAREKKRSGAWMADCRSRRRVDNVRADPVAYLTCNFTPPAAGLPSLLTHSEVVTLFHEFGHGLHHMLTQQSFATLAGINGVEWDAVELPSQFMENWCWQAESLAQVASHHETGESCRRNCSTS